jgi:hypothetical protein
MVGTMRLPIILHTGNIQVLHAIGKVASLYHRHALSHTCFFTLFCSRVEQCSPDKGGTSLENELYRLEGEIILQNAAGKDAVKKRFSQTWLGFPSVDENLGATGSREAGFAAAGLHYRTLSVTGD